MTSHEVQNTMGPSNDQNRKHASISKPIQGPLVGQEVRDPPEALLKVLMLVYNFAFNIVHRLYHSGQRMLTDFHLRELVDEIGVFLGSHPVAAVVFAVVTVACGIPILIYIAFAIVTIFLTFSGFLLIEGAVLAAGSVALIVCLVTMTSVFTVMGIVGAILYCTFMQVASFVGATPSSESMRQFDSRIPQVLASLRQIPSGASSRHRHSRGHQVAPINNGALHQHSDQ